MKVYNRGYNNDTNNDGLTYIFLPGSMLNTLHNLVYLILTAVIISIFSLEN